MMSSMLQDSHDYGARELMSTQTEGCINDEGHDTTQPNAMDECLIVAGVARVVGSFSQLTVSRLHDADSWPVRLVSAQVVIHTRVNDSFESPMRGTNG